MKLINTLVALVCSAVMSNAAVIIVTNNRGPANTREIVPPSLTLTTGFGGFGIISESGIAGASTTFQGLNFVQWGAGGGAVTTSTSGQFSYSGDVNPELPANASFVGRNVYLLVGFGGTDLATSTSLFIYRFNSQFPALNSPTPTTLTLTDTLTPGSMMFGSFQGGLDPQTTSSSRYVAAALAPIPETSTSLLGAIGALALLRRRRN